MIALLAAAKVVVAMPAPAVRVDGALDEWAGATWTSDFEEKEPDYGAAPTDATEVAIAFDDDAIYVAARMALHDAAALDRPMTRRDDTNGAERFIVSFDPYRSRRVAYSFAVTAAGVRADWIHTDDSERDRDGSWNPVWDAAVQVGADAWTCELRIPLSQLRFPDEDEPVWGVDFNRYVPHTGEDDFWIAVPKDVTGWASYFGELRGLDVRPKLQLELLPYLAGAFPFPGDGGRGNAGLGAKLGLGTGLTLDATVNPDFGQVEADPAVVSLDAFEVTFDERRPFFVEGSQIFGSNPRKYFYSRRIGAGGARIIGAAKLTGHATPSTEVGLLSALTLATDDAPAATWSVGRVVHDLPNGGLVGGIVTAVGRDHGFDDVLPRGALTGGLDLRLRPDAGRYEIFAAAGGTAVSGTKAAITALQRDSAHYWQRPDAQSVALDPDATSMLGWHGDLAATKRDGKWRWDVRGGAESPGLEQNDLGVLHSAEDLDLYVEGSFTQPTGWRWVHRWAVALADAEEWNFDLDRTPGYLQARSSATLPHFWGAELDVGWTRPGVSDDATRGGPVMGVGGGADVYAAISSPHAGAIDGSAHVSVVGLGHEQVGVEAGASFLWRVIDRLRFEIDPRFKAGTAYKQYVDAIAGGNADTFGTRYVFGTLELREAAVQLRGQLSLSPDLTIDAYVEPFVSRGRFASYGELPRPRSRALRRYDHVARAGGTVTVLDGADTFTFDDPDFDIRSLRSTVVVRWEYLPGSVAYAVWQESHGLGPDEEVVAVKISYWWSP